MGYMRTNERARMEDRVSTMMCRCNGMRRPMMLETFTPPNKVAGTATKEMFMDCCKGCS